ncbi:unnamed protein product [Candidula unifasciata]|uniref:Uncharacterized protein n=1 Tax=Candidula unifasciata TaxID=100452 RepID=A0A8S3YD55_9EUPU|nr:unnamed protein product [Candidula unifasciata]
MDSEIIRLTGLILFYFCTALLAADDCTYQACFCEGTQIICQDRGLSAIPPIVGTGPDNPELMFDTNNIMAIQAGSLPKHLKRFTAFDNPLTTIDSSAFVDSESTLEVLQLSNFRFTRFPDAFMNLTHLKYITMYDANILDWNAKVMKNIGPGVLSLDLQNMGIVAWPDWIQFFRSLITLSLDDGGIDSLPDNALDMLANSLTTLSMNNNSLTAIPKAVSRLKALQILTLYHNKIIDIAWLPHSSNITSLGLSYNRLFNATQLSLSLRPLAGSLNQINLVGNRFTEIPDLSFLKHVSGLDFSYNQLSDSQAGPLPSNIFNLNLEYNYLRRIPGVFSKLPTVMELMMTTNVVTEIQASDFSPWIATVDLSFNKIMELTDTSFPQNSTITTLNLNNNPIATISQNVFNNLLRLGELNMKNTKIARLPVALSVLTNVNFFEVDGSPYLVCTCMEKSLAQWILSRPNMPDGYCGLSTIRNFYFTLSQYCP